MATPDDHRLAAELAERTGTLLLRLRDRLVADGASADVVKRCGDLAAHQYLVDRLATERPEDAVLSEEATEDEQQDHARLTAPRVWIVDPLDGTREYGEGRSDWAVHVALVEEQVSILPSTPTLLRRLIASGDPAILARSKPERITLGGEAADVDERLGESQGAQCHGASRSEGLRVGLESLELLQGAAQGGGVGRAVELLTADFLLDDEHAPAHVAGPALHLLAHVLFF
jgi:hypothetical protein